MSEFSCIKKIMIGQLSLQLLLRDQYPYVEYDGRIFQHIWLLAQECILLSDSAYLAQFAEISNFFWKGLSFRFIEDIEGYQKFYHQRIQEEKQCPGDIFPYRLTDYKIFDVSIMHLPQVSEGTLRFFVYQVETGLPYRVICPFPYLANSTHVHYQILPIVS